MEATTSTPLQETLAFFVLAAEYIVRMPSHQSRVIQSITTRPNWMCGRQRHRGFYDTGCPACRGERYAWELMPRIRQLLEEQRIIALDQHSLNNFMEHLHNSCECPASDLVGVVGDLGDNHNAYGSGDIIGMLCSLYIRKLEGAPVDVKLPNWLTDRAACLSTYAELDLKGNRLRLLQHAYEQGILPRI